MKHSDVLWLLMKSIDAAKDMAYTIGSQNNDIHGPDGDLWRQLNAVSRSATKQWTNALCAERSADKPSSVESAQIEAISGAIDAVFRSLA